MRNTSTNSADTWVVTDVDGGIQEISSRARALLGLGVHSYGRNLLLFFPRHRRHVIFDIEVALTGWPSVRTAVLMPMARRPLTVRYLVSRQLRSGSVELHWSFDLIREDLAAAS